MTSDKERREIAERIRALPSDIYSTIKEWEKDGLFIGATLCDEADYSQIHNAVFGCFPPEYVHPGDREELHERLADLIDPTCEVEGSIFDEHVRVRVASVGAPPELRTLDRLGRQRATEILPVLRMPNRWGERG